MTSLPKDLDRTSETAIDNPYAVLEARWDCSPWSCS